MERIIDIILTPGIRNYDTKAWREDALQTLASNNSNGDSKTASIDDISNEIDV